MQKGMFFFGWLFLFLSCGEEEGLQKKLTVRFLNVGGGDTILLTTPNHQCVAIDGGGGVEYYKNREQCNYQKLKEVVRNECWDSTLQKAVLRAVVLSHPHSDHCEGLRDLLKDCCTSVENIILNENESASCQGEEKIIKSVPKTTVNFPKSGDLLDWDPDLTVEVLYSQKVEEGAEYHDVNNTSLVIRVTYKQTSFLFPGDIESSVEEKLVQEMAAKLDVDVLKVGHHGSSTSTAQSFLNAVSPLYAIISNNYVTSEADSVCERLQVKSDIQIYRTYLHGTIVIESGGENYQIKTEKDGPMKRDCKEITKDKSC